VKVGNKVIRFLEPIHQLSKAYYNRGHNKKVFVNKKSQKPVLIGQIKKLVIIIIIIESSSNLCNINLKYNINLITIKNIVNQINTK